MDRSKQNGRDSIILKAPLSGCLMPIERVPDPVFAQKMVGDGVALDPLSQVLVAPCEGEVIQLHAAGHAVTIRTHEGIEVLMHIGLDTVNLKGDGFTPKVKTGDRVITGDALIEFDADYVATHAKSLLTQIVITNSDRVAQFTPQTGTVQSGSDTILELVPIGTCSKKIDTSAKALTSEAILVLNPTGLHARPAAVLANLAKKFNAEVLLQKDGEKGNAKSVVAILGMDIQRGDKVVLVAKGNDASEALVALVPQIQQGLGDAGCVSAPAPATTTPSEATAPAPRPDSGDPDILQGVAASPGLAVGNVFQVRHEEFDIEEDADDPRREQRQLEDAMEKAKIQLEALQARLKSEADPGKAAIFAAHQELLGDPDLLDIAISAIAKGKSAAFAWKQAYSVYSDKIAGLKNELLAARANDLRDVGWRVLQCLTGQMKTEQMMPANTVLVAEDLTPSDTATLDRSRVFGFCTTRGGATSHVAILARSLDIPAVAGIDPKSLELADGTPVILDGSTGTLRINPSPEEVERIHRRQEKQEAKRKADIAEANNPAQTTDGHRVEVVANAGNLSDAQQMLPLGGEGIGLLRSEFLFMERATAPSEDEQFTTYKSIAQVLGKERPFIIRTLDVGGDKPLPYLPIPQEDNPFLGERGIRVGLDRPELLRTQLRAILRTAEFGDVRIMFPMVGTLQEWRDARAILEEERSRLGIDPVPVGIMIEVPAAAVMAEQFAREADFFSIGTNDLTQYVLAMDRGHPKLAPKVDALNPAVLHLIARTVEGAHQHGKWTGVCGGIAGDLQAVPILVGLGVDELSVSVPALPAVKSRIREYSLDACTELAQKALAAGTAAEVREFVPLDLE